MHTDEKKLLKSDVHNYKVHKNSIITVRLYSWPSLQRIFQGCQAHNWSVESHLEVKRFSVEYERSLSQQGSSFFIGILSAISPEDVRAL